MAGRPGGAAPPGHVAISGWPRSPRPRRSSVGLDVGALARGEAGDRRLEDLARCAASRRRTRCPRRVGERVGRCLVHAAPAGVDLRVGEVRHVDRDDLVESRDRAGRPAPAPGRSARTRNSTAASGCGDSSVTPKTQVLVKVVRSAPCDGRQGGEGDLLVRQGRLLGVGQLRADPPPDRQHGRVALLEAVDRVLLDEDGRAGGHDLVGAGSRHRSRVAFTPASELKTGVPSASKRSPPLPQRRFIQTIRFWPLSLP